MKRLEQIAAAIMLVLAAIIVFDTGDLTYWSGLSPGNRFVPLWVAGVSAVLALLLFREAMLRQQDQPVDWPDRDGVIRVGGTFAAICALPIAVSGIGPIPGIGFLLTTAVFVLVILLVLLRRRLLPSLLAMVVTAGTIYIVFISWLSIPLPKGFLGI